jgi:hypothetical protein
VLLTTTSTESFSRLNTHSTTFECRISCSNQSSLAYTRNTAKRPRSLPNQTNAPNGVQHGYEEVQRPKGHKKAQKEKAIVKRAATATIAAEQSNSKKVQQLVTKVDPLVSKDAVNKNLVQRGTTSPTKVTSEKELASIDAVYVHNGISAVQNSVLVNHGTCKSDLVLLLRNSNAYTLSDAVQEENLHSSFEDEKTNMAVVLITALPSTTTNNTGITQDEVSKDSISMTNYVSNMDAFNISSHRKAIESELYDNMESPKEWFARINRVASATFERHHDVHDYEDCIFPENSLVETCTAKNAVDDNGWECVAVCDDAPMHALITQISLVDQLFSTVTDTEVFTTGTSTTKTSYTLDMVEEQPKAVSADAQLPRAEEKDTTFFMTLNEFVVPVHEPDGPPVVCMPTGAGDMQTRAARARAYITAGMTFGWNNELAKPQASADLANISYTVRNVARNISTRYTVQRCVKSLIFICPDEIVEVHHPSIDPPVITFKVKEQQDSQEDVHEPSAATSCSSEFAAASAASSEKLMAILCIGDRVPIPESASNAHLSRTTSYGSSAQAQDISTITTDGFNTPLNHHSVSSPPPPVPNDDFATKNRHKLAFNDNAYAWAPNSVGFFNTLLYVF